MTLGPCPDRAGSARQTLTTAVSWGPYNPFTLDWGSKASETSCSQGLSPHFWGVGHDHALPLAQLCPLSSRLQVPLATGWGHILGKRGHCWYRTQSSWLSAPRSQEAELLTVCAASIKCPKTQNSCQKSWILVSELPQPVVWCWELFRFQGSDPLSVNWGMRFSGH